MNQNNSQNLNRSFRNVFLYISIFILVTSCGDEAGTFGLDILPDADKVEALYTDTFSITMESVPGEPFFSGNGRYGLVGGYYDPFFGYSEATFAMEYYPMAYKIDSVKPIIDSVKFSFDVGLVYGDTAQPLNLEIYTLTNPLPGDSMFYSDLSITPYAPELLTSVVVKPELGVNTIVLSNDFGASFLDYERFDLDSLYAYKNYFNEQFPGLYFKASRPNEKGSIINIDLLSDNTRLRIYYHEADRDTIAGQIAIDAFYSNPFNQTERYVENNVNLFHHDYSNASFSFPPQNNDSVVYIQSMGGVRVKAAFPGLDKWIDENEKITIHSAELLVFREDFDKSYPIFKPSRQLGLRAINAEGEEERVEDSFIGSQPSQYFGGTLLTDYTYLPINLTRFVSSIVNHEVPNNGFYLYSAGAGTNYAYDYQSPGRVILTNANNSRPPLLKIIYTPLK